MQEPRQGWISDGNPGSDQTPQRQEQPRQLCLLSASVHQQHSKSSVGLSEDTGQASRAGPSLGDTHSSKLEHKEKQTLGPAAPKAPEPWLLLRRAQPCLSAISAGFIHEDQLLYYGDVTLTSRRIHWPGACSLPRSPASTVSPRAPTPPPPPHKHTHRYPSSHSVVRTTQTKPVCRAVLTRKE